MLWPMHGVMPPMEESFLPSTTAARVRASMSLIQPALDVLANVLVERQEGFIVAKAVFTEVVAERELSGHLSEIHHIYVYETR